MEITIRKMRPEDVDEVCVMEEESFSMPWHKESFMDMIANRNALYVVAEVSNIGAGDLIDQGSKNEQNSADDTNDDTDVRVVGCAGLISVAGEGDICNIVVKKEFRRLGIGRRLIQSMIEAGKNEFGIEAFTLEVRKSNEAAINLYEELGFVCEGLRPGFYIKPKEDAYIYWLRSAEEI